MAEWSAHLVDTRTGNLTARLDVLGAGTWSDLDIKVDAGKQALRGVPPMDWMVPYRSSILVTCDGLPLVLGPIVQVPQVTRSQVSFTAGSLWDLLKYRIGLDADYRPGDGAALAGSVLSLTGSLGTIAWQLVQAALNRRGGWLPVVHGSPDELDPTNERNWKGFDLANLDVAHLLELLAGVGPDIRFDAGWADDTGRRVQWVMRNGTKVSPDIPQSVTLLVDTTAARGRAGEPQIVCGWLPVAKIYATGAGQDSATPVAIVEHEYLLNNLPLLETTMADSSAEDMDLLASRAQARLDRSQTMTVQVNTSLDCEGGMHPGLWHPGDWARVQLGADWWPLPGRLDARIVTRKGRLGSMVVDVELQSEVDLRWLSEHH